MSKVFPNFPIPLIVRFLLEHQTTFPLRNHWKIIEVIGRKDQVHVDIVDDEGTHRWMKKVTIDNWCHFESKDCAINIWWLSSNFEMLKLSTSASFTWIGGWIDEQSFLPEKKPSFLHEKKPRENPIFQAVLQAKRKRHINSFYRKENLKRFKYANTDTFCVWQYLNVKNIKQCQTLQYGKYIDWFRNENKDKVKKNRRSYAAWQKEKVKVKEGKRLIVADTIVWGDAE